MLGSYFKPFVVIYNFVVVYFDFVIKDGDEKMKEGVNSIEDIKQITTAESTDASETVDDEFDDVDNVEELLGMAFGVATAKLRGMLGLIYVYCI